MKRAVLAIGITPDATPEAVADRVVEALTWLDIPGLSVWHENGFLVIDTTEEIVSTTPRRRIRDR